MSKPKYKWWGYIKNVIRDYPALVKEYNALHEQSVTANMSGMPGGGNGVSRGTEGIALRELSKPRQAELDAVKKAVAETERLQTGNDRMRLVQLVFWKQSHTLQGAAMMVNISYDTAVHYHGYFIMLVAYYKDLVTHEELVEWRQKKTRKKSALKSQNNML